MTNIQRILASDVTWTISVPSVLQTTSTLQTVLQNTNNSKSMADGRRMPPGMDVCKHTYNWTTEKHNASSTIY